MFTTTARTTLRTVQHLFPRRQAVSKPLLATQLISRKTMASAAAAATKRLEGKTVVITGASSGIGRSCAFEFARTAPRNGLKLVLTARRIDTLHQVAADIKKEVGDGVEVLPVQLDVSKPEEVRSFVPSLPEGFKDIHVLVNNAYGDPLVNPLVNPKSLELYKLEGG